MFGRGIGSKDVGGATSEVRHRSIPSRELERARPVWLVDIAPVGGCPELHLAEVNVVVQGVRYEDYLNALSGVGEKLSRLDSSGGLSDVSIEVDNSAFMTYAYFSELGEDCPFEGAACKVRCAWLDLDGTLLETEDVFSGTLGGAKGATLSGFKLTARSAELKGDI